jgi:hypothetical protein
MTNTIGQLGLFGHGYHAEASFPVAGDRLHLRQPSKLGKVVTIVTVSDNVDGAVYVCTNEAGSTVVVLQREVLAHFKASR